MRIGLFHGYELFGSGSNEYCRYLAKTLLQQNHTVHIICRERNPEEVGFLGEAWAWNEDGSKTVTKLNDSYRGKCTLHQIPAGPIYPVYVTGKQRPKGSKSFVNLTDQELAEFKRINEKVLSCIFEQIELDVLQANHLVMQPSVALEPCKVFNIPMIIYPHGSAIEYTVKKDQRFTEEARTALIGCSGIISGNREVRDRITKLFPDLKQSILAKTEIVGVGVDTSLFVPITNKQKPGHWQQLLQSTLLDNPRGKSPTLVHELHEKLKNGDYQAMDHYHDAYEDKGLDTDIVDKLKRVNFSEPILLFVGALTAGKGLQALLSALCLVYKTLPSSQLIIVGSGAYREVLEALIYALSSKNQKLLSYLVENGFDLDKSDETGPWQDLFFFTEQENNLDRLFDQAYRLNDQVHFLGRMNHQQLSYVYPCADLTIFPSVIPEAYPLVLMESLANGVLPLVSYFSGFKDGIDELNQYLPAELVDNLKITVKPEQRITGLADSIITLIKQTKQQDLSEKLAVIAQKNYDWNHRAKAMVEAFTNLIANDRAG